MSSLRIHVAPDLCCGHHRCAEIAPSVYELEDGFNRMDGHVVPKGLEQEARYGAEACPESAIELIEIDD
jgi:ferredoxin